jgi:hypothetical protein
VTQKKLKVDTIFSISFSATLSENTWHFGDAAADEAREDDRMVTLAEPD